MRFGLELGKGLNVYNGRNFKNYSYNKKDIGSISNNVIWQIIEQNDSIMWVSTDYGINQWKRSTKNLHLIFWGRKVMLLNKTERTRSV